MNFTACIAGLIVAGTIVHSAEPLDTVRDAGELDAVKAILARFKSEPTSKSEPKNVTVISADKLKTHLKEAGTVSIRINGEGHVTGVTANIGDFANDEYKLFAAFPDMEAVTLWHNFAIGPKVAPDNSDGTGLKHLMNLKKLTRVTLAGGSLNDAGMAVAAKLPTLKEMHIWHARFTDEGIAAFRDHPTLEVIRLGPMWTNALTDKSLESLATCPKLRQLKLDETWLTWENGLKHLVQRKDTLKKLELGNALIEPADFEKLKAALPDTMITWDGLAGAGAAINANSWTRAKADKWIPKELLERATKAKE